jgi:pilus assembly protein Flp/PilA
MIKKIKALFQEEEGQGMTEYGLVLGIIAVAVVGALVLLRGQIVEMFDKVVTSVTEGNDRNTDTTTP